MISSLADRHDLAAGARAMAPWLLGIVPFGLVIGLSAAQADIPTLAGWLTGPLIYAGSAQVATIQMLDAGAAPIVVVVAALVINIRLLLYSATMAPYWRGTPWWWRLLAAYLLIDPSLAVGLDGYERLTDQRRSPPESVHCWSTGAERAGTTIAALSTPVRRSPRETSGCLYTRCNRADTPGRVDQ